MCGDSHLTGVADCGDNYWNPIKPTMSPSNAKRKPTPKKTPSFTVNTKKRSFAPGIPGQVKTTNKADIRTKAPSFNPGDFPSLANAQTKASGWVGAASGPLSPSPTEVALVMPASRQRTFVPLKKAICVKGQPASPA
ncbi:hypothetical protein HPB51_028399 [Rhipicephalus microplus]|uniref:Uncharacterized protein n=1 Tax=Rhipicephalus microplus TaxID=6941 RepID=A0A9J6CX55_RHIMP|nr:hypothetical protein HPB51_028399 [Rhipicephalus microplus]